MIERPIIFDAPMVRAILEGRKTQTRRLANIAWARADAYPVIRQAAAEADAAAGRSLAWALKDADWSVRRAALAAHNAEQKP